MNQVLSDLVLDVQDNQPLPADDYACVVDRIERVESVFGGEKKQQFMWCFRVVRGEYADREIRGWTARNSERGSKLYQWFCVVQGIPLTEKIEQINLAALYGKNVIVSLDQYLNQAGLVRNKVTQLRAPKKHPAPAPSLPDADAAEIDPFDDI